MRRGNDQVVLITTKLSPGTPTRGGGGGGGPLVPIGPIDPFKGIPIVDPHLYGSAGSHFVGSVYQSIGCLSSHVNR